MKRPTKVKVSYAWHRIEWVDDDKVGELGAFGDYAYSLQRIRVSTRVPLPFQCECLLHEILHAIDEHWDLPTNSTDENQPPKGKKRHETIITGFADGLCQVMVDNPGLWEWISYGLKKREVEGTPEKDRSKARKH